MNNYGKVIIKVNKQYSIEDIKYINIGAKQAEIYVKFSNINGSTL